MVVYWWVKVHPNTRDQNGEIRKVVISFLLVTTLKDRGGSKMAAKQNFEGFPQ